MLEEINAIYNNSLSPCAMQNLWGYIYWANPSASCLQQQLIPTLPPATEIYHTKYVRVYIAEKPFLEKQTENASWKSSGELPFVIF